MKQDSASGGTPRTALYRHFDEDGVLLYVGISLSAVYRLSQHRNASHWSMRIALVKVEYFPTRAEAKKAERLAIMEEKPLHNQQHRKRELLTKSESETYLEYVMSIPARLAWMRGR